MCFATFFCAKILPVYTEVFVRRKVIICGVDTSALPKLTQKQSKELLQKISQGDKDARTYFINCNIRLVLSVVQRYSSHGNNLDDLFQIGCVGLIKSVDNFNPQFGVCFSTYAVPMIAGEIRRYIRESNSLRVSRGIRDVAYLALKAREKLENGQDVVSIDDIAEELQLPVYKVLYCLDAVSDPISLSDPVYSDDEDSVELQTHLADKTVSETSWVENICLEDAINCLDEKERAVIMKRYFQGKTQNEVSKEVGLSQAQISRIEKTALGHLHNNMV